MLMRGETHKSKGEPSKFNVHILVAICIPCREPFRFLLSHDASELNEHFTQHLKWTSLEARPREVENASSTLTSLPGVLDESQVFLPGSGMTKKVYSLGCVVSVHVNDVCAVSGLRLIACVVGYSSSRNLRMIVLIVFCSQGDNIQDAVALMEHLDQWISITQLLVHVYVLYVD